MISMEIFIISILRGLIEVAMLVLLGQGLLALLAGSKRTTNPIYQLFQVVTRPVLRMIRLITPRAIVDRHLPVVAFFLLFWLWIFLAYTKRMVGGMD